jgi:membrane associated rhomboid family serine protease
MVLLPINTDAPIYYWPWMTLLLIVVNFVTFVLTAGGLGDAADAWILEYGDGLHPVEWISCNFVHLGLMHLIGNMVFLWGFGLVVEGKVGWWRFLLIYLGIGIVHSFVEQLIMLDYDGSIRGSGGASGILFGLLAMSLVWAPKNDMFCVFWFFFYVKTFYLSILVFSSIYLGMQTLLLWLNDFSMSSEFIHMLGAITGFVIATMMLKLDWVDCENWDLFAVLKGTHGGRR